jgi:uncharacterized protein (DUF305 family)
VLASCGAHAEVVEVGGARPGTVERPWGTVKLFPAVQKAQIPTMDDLDFARHMIAHHRQAIELSELVLRHGDLDERIAATARFIRHDQTAEITAMQGWLDAWQRTSEVLPHGSHHGAASAPMPDMVAVPAISRLARLGTADAQLGYANLMIQHHQDAVAMSQQVLPEGANDFVLDVARHIIGEQRLEMTYLRRLIDDLCAEAPCAR